MKVTRWGAMLLLSGLMGCLPASYTNRKSTPETMQALPGGSWSRPRLVVPEQVNERNARQQGDALAEELDREEARPQ